MYDNDFYTFLLLNPWIHFKSNIFYIFSLNTLDTLLSDSSILNYQMPKIYLFDVW